MIKLIPRNRDFFLREFFLSSECKSIIFSCSEKYIASKLLVLFFSNFIIIFGLILRFFLFVTKSHKNFSLSFETFKVRFIESDKSIVSSSQGCKSFICSIKILKYFLFFYIILKKFKKTF